MAPFAGVGYLTVADILTDCAYALIEPSVAQQFPVNVAAGVQTINAPDPAIYVGASLVAGSGGDLEVVVVTAVVVGVSFTANFANAHTAGEPIFGPTFPVRQPTDPFFTQPEMLQYIAQAVNDFLTAVPLVVNVAEITVPPTQQITALPADCMKPVRIAFNDYPLKETSQSSLDIIDYRWQLRAASGPESYFRDKVGLQNVGVTPRANNASPLEVVYEQRGAATVNFADGFLIPDPFLIYVKYRVLEYAYSKDGEQRNPGLAKWYNGRYEFGCKVSNMFLEAIMDPNLELAQ